MKQRSNNQVLSRKDKASGSCNNCGGDHGKEESCPAKGTECYYCGKTGHYKRMCMKRKQQRRVHEVAEQDYDSNDEGSYYASSVIGSVTTVSQHTTHTVHAVKADGLDKIYANVTFNNATKKTKLKIDTGSDACLLSLADWKKSGLADTVKMRRSNCVLHNYGGGEIRHVGIVTLTVSCRGKSTTADFKIVDTAGSPSIIGCRESLRLGLLTFNNVHGITKASSSVASGPQVSLEGKQQQQGSNIASNMLSKEGVLEEYGDCFDKVGKFPGEKYHIQLVDDAKPVIHAPRTVPVHIMPLYKAELEKMIKDGIISAVKGPTDWVNSIVVNVTDTPGGKKVRLCLDPKDLNRNTKREHYVTRTIDEILPKLHGKKYFTVMDTKKGYWHVELDDESSLLTTFNTPFGRYRFNRLPFGLWMSQDIFQPRSTRHMREFRTSQELQMT